MRRIKNNRFIRGFYFLIKTYFGFKRKSFGYIADNVIITPPYGWVESRMFFYMRIQT